MVEAAVADTANQFVISSAKHSLLLLLLDAFTIHITLPTHIHGTHVLYNTIADTIYAHADFSLRRDENGRMFAMRNLLVEM